METNRGTLSTKSRGQIVTPKKDKETGTLVPYGVREIKSSQIEKKIARINHSFGIQQKRVMSALYTSISNIFFGHSFSFSFINVLSEPFLEQLQEIPKIITKSNSIPMIS
ncbi:hypothetical protein HPP92_021334 [Vanilla planifolia]|uniref:Uncharacterized protein n=1 Tax=Vanilla planifolia TaxID=51239 RepID=A0A835Q5E2_VANPL|nr:hypothetical protein HPP92_021334 [Vanilla planifolia]